jgi:hypothetical protein
MLFESTFGCLDKYSLVNITRYSFFDLTRDLITLHGLVESRFSFSRFYEMFDYISTGLEILKILKEGPQ